jgi:hypothetical protein
LGSNYRLARKTIDMTKIEKAKVRKMVYELEHMRYSSEQKIRLTDNMHVKEVQLMRISMCNMFNRMLKETFPL